MKICSVEGCDGKHLAKGFCNKHYQQFKKYGKILNEEEKRAHKFNPNPKRNDRVGEINYNKFGTEMIIIEYHNSHEIIVEFQDKYKYRKKTKYRSFSKGDVKNPYDKTVYDIGYLGVGEYVPMDQNNKTTKCYKTWSHMIERCYSKKCKEKQPTYKDCTVCKEWHNFQNFAQWYYDNYYEIPGDIMQLDKDILIKDNKIYCPDACCFVNQRINKLFTKTNAKRGDLPIGITKRKTKLEVRCNIMENDKVNSKHLGYFKLDQVEEAFQCYKEFKESYIKQVADEYFEYIPIELYDAMYNWIVEIDD